MRAIFERPLDYASEEYEAFSPPRVSVRCSAREKLRLLEALDGSQRLQLVPASVVRMKFRNGLFAIPKDGARDRMVLDARPPNMLEDPSCPWIRTLASVSQLNHLFMKDDEEMRLFAEDLREFYHAFLIAPQRVLRNALACQVDPREVSHLGCFHDGLWGQGSLVPCLGTMAMGDCHAVSFGQIAHLSVLLRSGAVSLDDFLMLHSRPSRKEWVAGLMIDDLVLLERRVRAGEPDVDCLSRPPTTCEKIIEEVRRQYEEVGLPRHEGKAVYNSLEGTFWGVQLDGRRGDVRPSLKRSIPLAFIIQRVVKLRRATVGLLELMAGSLVAVFQTRRRLMSILEGIYDAQRGRERGDVVALSPELCDELLVAVALIPLAFIDLRLKASPDLVASDASSTSEAAVVCDVGPTATGELHRHTLQKGLWNRLLSPVQAYMREKDLLDACEELPDDTFEGLYGMHPVWEEIVASQRFEQLGVTVLSRSRRHINIGEVKAALQAEECEGARHPDSYYVHLQDSQVSLACLLKGRSSSRSINRELKKSIPAHVTSGVRPFYGYVRSKRNPADDPTRKRNVRPPEREEASWLGELKGGNYAPFDEFLFERGLHVSQTRGVPPESELWADPPLDARSGIELRRQRSSKEAKRDKTDAAQEKKAQITEDEAQLRPQEAEKEALQRSQNAEAAAQQRLQTTEDEVQRRLQTTEDEVQQRLQATEDEAQQKSLVERKRAPQRLLVDEVGPAQSVQGNGSSGGGHDGPAASPRYFGRAGAKLDEAVVQELLKFDKSQFVFSPCFPDLEAALRSGPGILDLFAGSRGLSRACCRAAPVWSLTFDIDHSPREDLLNKSLQGKLLGLVRSGAFFAMVAGPVCASFSTAITPPCRTLEHPKGTPWCSPLQQLKNELGNSMLRFILRITLACLRAHVLFLVENPDSSWLWRQVDEGLTWAPLLEQFPEVGDLRLDFCRFGTAWRKRTKFRCNFEAAGQTVFCKCCSKHTVLRGRCLAKGVNYTKFAEPYPRKLCGILASSLLTAAGFFGKTRKLDIAACAKAGQGRIGEASHPGPRQVAGLFQRRAVNLAGVELLEPVTITFRAKIWSRFLAWADDGLGPQVAQEWLSFQQQLFVELLVAFGYYLFHIGDALHTYRQLLAHVQREHPVLRLFMPRAWNVVHKWERVEPTTHRTPIPEPILLAMTSLALNWGWRRFAAVLLYSFYSVSRVGEVLRAKRSQVLTPKDLLFESNTVYLRVLNPKTRNSGARTQYSCTDEELCVNLVSSIWDRLLPDQWLYDGSASAFRYRWNALLRKLTVPPSLHLTPGSLRGGGAVSSYRKGAAIDQLMWKMRILHQKTLASYLQEMVAASVLPALPTNVLEHIKQLQGILPFLIAVEMKPAAPAT